MKTALYLFVAVSFSVITAIATAQTTTVPPPTPYKIVHRDACPSDQIMRLI